MDFDNIYEEYFDRVYYKVLSVVKNNDDAEDICQETFISVYKNLSKFREESNIYTWIYRIAINKTYDFFKKRKLEFEINDDVLSLPEDVNFDTKVILQEKLKLISEIEKRNLEMFYNDGYEDIKFFIKKFKQSDIEELSASRKKINTVSNFNFRLISKDTFIENQNEIRTILSNQVVFYLDNLIIRNSLAIPNREFLIPNNVNNTVISQIFSGD